MKTAKVPFRAPLVYEFDTCREAFEGMLFKFLYDEDFPIAYHGGPRAVVNDITVVVHNPTADINFVRCGMGENRWKKFCREYMDLPTLRGWMGAFWSRQAGQEIAYHTPPVANHSLGNCLLYLTVNGHPPFRLTGMTRSSQLTPTGGLDLSFLALMSERLSELANLDKPMPIIWGCGNMWLMVLFAGNYLTTMPGELEKLQDYVANSSNPTWSARETLKHINYAIDNKQVNWRTFMRAWKNTRENIWKVERGEPLTEYYPTLPLGLTSPFQRGSYNIEQLENHIGNTKKWILHRTHQFRRFITQRWGFSVPQTFDMVYSTDHPEFMATLFVYHNGGSVDNLPSILEALKCETEEEAKAYCYPYYKNYQE